MSLTFTLTDKSDLAACYFPVVDLSDGDYELYDYEVYETDFETYRYLM